MKRVLFFILFVLSFAPFRAYASHILGTDMAYKYVSTGPAGDIYTVTLTVYENCSSTVHDSLDFAGYTPVIHVFDTLQGKFPPLGDPRIQAYNLHLIPDSTKDVSPFCALDLPLSSCNNINNPYNGIRRFVYAGNITIGHKSNGWEIIFVSNMVACDNGDQAGKPVCANIRDDHHNNAICIAILNNSSTNPTGRNNSVVFNSQRSGQYFVIGSPSTFVENAVDADNDVLVYKVDSLYTRYDTAGGNFSNSCYNNPEGGGFFGTQTQIFNTGYSLTHPIDAQAGTYSFNSANGNMYFTPSLVNKYAIGITVTEYRNGVVVGSVYRQAVLIVLNGGAVNVNANMDTTKISGATIGGKDTLYACPGNVISFHAPVKDGNGDTVKVTFYDIIGGSTITVDSNNTVTPVINFSWNTAAVPYGVYTLTPNFFINSCPLITNTTHTYTIIINNAGLVAGAVLSETHCIYKAAVRYEVQNNNSNPNIPYTLTITLGSTVVRTYTDSTAQFINDSLPAGKYTLTLSTQGRPCNSFIALDVPDNGVFPYQPTVVTPVEYCLNGHDSALVAHVHVDSLNSYVQWYDPSHNYISGDPVPPVDKAGTFLYTATQVYKSCESLPDTVTVIIDKDPCDYDVKIHNVITPNGDGINDLWVIENLKFYPEVKVQIFDKLGDRVFSQERYANTWNGGSLPSGVYYYVVDLGIPNIATGQQKYTGYFVIKR